MTHPGPAQRRVCAIDAKRLVLSQALHAQAGRAESERARAGGREQSQVESEQGGGKHATSQVGTRTFCSKALTCLADASQAAACQPGNWALLTSRAAGSQAQRVLRISKSTTKLLVVAEEVGEAFKAAAQAGGVGAARRQRDLLRASVWAARDSSAEPLSFSPIHLLSSTLSLNIYVIIINVIIIIIIIIIILAIVYSSFALFLMLYRAKLPRGNLQANTCDDTLA